MQVLPDPAFDRNNRLCLDGRVIRQGSHALNGGAFSDVWEGTLDKRRVAIKVIRWWDSAGRPVGQDKLLKRLWREYLAWSSLSHPNVLECLGFCYNVVDSPESYSLPSLISPWMANGSLTEFFRKHPTADRLSFLLGIAEGLSYLHTRQPAIVHGDLKQDNILVSELGVPCLCDFGLAKILTEAGGLTTSSGRGGSLRWMSPELLMGPDSGVTVKSDVWAFGMTTLEIMSGHPPYAAIYTDLEVMDRIKKGIFPDDVDVRNDLWEICKQCWESNSSNRPSMRSVLSMLREPEAMPPQEQYSQNPEFRMGKILSISTHSVVREAVRLDTGRYYACKAIKREIIKGRERMTWRELYDLKRVSKGHRNIVTLHNYLYTSDELYSYFDLCTGEGVLERICAQSSYYENNAAVLVRTILDAIQYLHDHDIVHRDLHPENLMYQSTAEDADIVIVGFMSGRVIEEDVYNNVLGTPGYIDPRSYRKFENEKPIDILAIGMIAYFLLCGHSPFNRDFSLAEGEIIRDGHRFEPKEHWVNISQTARDFIDKCLTADRTLRPTATMALQHRWINVNHNMIGPEIRGGGLTNLLPNIQKVLHAKK